MRKILFSFIFSAACFFGSFGQQLPHFSNLTNARQYINPAFSGSSGNLIFSFLGREQWMGLENMVGEKINPQTFMFLFEMPLFTLHSGVGIMAYQDKVGLDQSMNIRLNYAFHKALGNNHQLSLGTSFEYQSLSINTAGFQVGSEGEEQASAFDLGLGLLYEHSNGLFFGVSAQNLLGGQFVFSDFIQNNATHLSLLAGTQVKILAKENFSLDFAPSFHFSSIRLFNQYTANATFIFNKNYYAGMVYRFEDAVGLIAGLSLFDFALGLSYDFTTSSLTDAGSKGTPEVFITYRKALTPKIKWRSLYNTRDL